MGLLKNVQVMCNDLEQFSDQPEAKQGLGIGMGMAFTGFNVNKAVQIGNKPAFKLPPLPSKPVSKSDILQ